MPIIWHKRQIKVYFWSLAILWLTPGLICLGGSSEGMQGRLGVGAGVFSGGGFHEGVGGLIGLGGTLNYGLTSRLVLDFSYGSHEQKLYDDLTTFDFTSTALGLEYRFRVDKKFMPYLGAGYGFFNSKGSVDILLSSNCLLGVSECKQEVEDTDGPFAGWGFTAFFNEKRVWAFGLDVKYFFVRKAGWTRTETNKLFNTPPVTTQGTIDLSGVLTAFSLFYFF